MSISVEPTLHAAIARARGLPSWDEGVRRPIEDKVYAVCRWAAAIQMREEAGLTADALSIVALGPQQFLPPVGFPMNVTGDLAVAFVTGGNDWAKVFQGDDGVYHYTVTAANNVVVETSKGYATIGNARRALYKRHPGVEVRQD